jgi:hypothetical protein
MIVIFSVAKSLAMRGEGGRVGRKIRVARERTQKKSF